MKRQYKENFKPHVGEFNSARKFGYYTETIGYVPIQRQVDSFFRAGQRIVDQFTDKDYDTSADDPVDDPTLDARDWELEDVGHAMAKLGQTIDGSRQAQVEAMSKVEASKNDIVGTPEDAGVEKSD